MEQTQVGFCGYCGAPTIISSVTPAGWGQPARQVLHCSANCIHDINSTDYVAGTCGAVQKLLASAHDSLNSDSKPVPDQLVNAQQLLSDLLGKFSPPSDGAPASIQAVSQPQVSNLHRVLAGKGLI